MPPSVLLVDDEPGIRLGFTGYLKDAGCTVRAAASLAEARLALSEGRYDVVLLDLRLPDGSGLDFIHELRDATPNVAIVVITGYGDIPIAVNALRLGADNFLTKPVNMADLDVYVKKGFELGSLRRGRELSERLTRPQAPYFGDSPQMRAVVEMAEVAAKNDSPVVLQGETGVGKGVLARRIHETCARGSAPFVEVNCSGLGGDLLASELFGHVKGSFTGAVQDRQGLLDAADGGTLFLDEIGDMDLSVQAQFLKAIEDKKYRRLGEVKERRSDFRLICATNRDLMSETKAGRFRMDLYFRIFVFPIRIPPLRERISDLGGLARRLMDQMGARGVVVPDEAMRLLESYSWPGNVRELKNVLERALMLAGGSGLTLSHFPGLDVSPPFQCGGRCPEDNEEARIKGALASHDGDVVKAAAELGMSRATLYRRLRKYREN